jgi:hypothetical protein
MKKSIIFIFICSVMLFQSSMSYAVVGAGAGVSIVALQQSEQNIARQQETNNKNAHYFKPPLNWANNHNCSLESTDRIGEYHCIIHSGYYEIYYKVNINEEGQVIKCNLEETLSYLSIFIYSILVSIIIMIIFILKTL